MTGDLEYECTRGHAISTVRPIDDCPGYRRGQRCDGQLHAVGEGSRAENQRLAERRSTRELVSA